MVYYTLCRKYLRSICLCNRYSSFLYVCLLLMVLRHTYTENNNSALINAQEISTANSNATWSYKFREYERLVIRKATEIFQRNETVLLCVVNNAYLPLAYSWLCNTLYMGIHDSLLLITTDLFSKKKLTKDWPTINIINLDLDIPQSNQFYSHVGYIKIMVLRTKIIVSLLKADMNIMLIEFDFIWFTNPIPYLRNVTGYDMLLQPVSNSKGMLVCGGFMFVFATRSSTVVFKKVSSMMSDLEAGLKNVDNSKTISRRNNDQEYLSHLIVKRYGGVSPYFLPNEKYADGKWYNLGLKQRSTLKPYVVHNNFVIGNKNKIKIAKLWKHWFLRSDGTCDKELVNTTVA